MQLSTRLWRSSSGQIQNGHDQICHDSRGIKEPEATFSSLDVAPTDIDPSLLSPPKPHNLEEFDAETEDKEEEERKR